ncbi:uncharacterized protein LOC127988182 [Carassius gibelio]|uniref:uncharacterized protein LOC127988182 n=1 Tax=Carassius gibelio TaxID=101364 RepID=UPI00227745EC|nr:uncharacterized protein LOC127988182 [Carassius gibelio]
MVNAVILFCVCLWCLLDATHEMKTVSVMEGESITLHIDVSEEQKYFLIQWMFGSIRIAEVNRLMQTSSTYGGPDERFRDRLHLDQTGSVTILNTRTTDSGLYKVTVISSETSYMTFNVTVYVNKDYNRISALSETPHSSSSPESSTKSNMVSSCVLNNSSINQTNNMNVTELHQPCSDHIHCCGFTEAVIRLVASALVSVAAVAFLVNDIRSTRSGLKRMEETRHDHQTHGVKSDQKYELSRRMSSRYVC